MTGREAALVEAWCPFAVRDEIRGASGAGSFTGGAAKILHHTTEGASYAGARGTYSATGDLPHFTDSYENGRYQAWQHLPLNVAATALAHPLGTGETNRDNVTQIEHVGFTARSAEFPASYLDGIGMLCRWIEAQTGCLRVAAAPFVPGAARFGWPAWHATSGHYGHMHAPFNDHTDPGALDIRRILAYGGQPPAPDPASPPLRYIDDETGEAMNRQLFDCGTLDGQGNAQIIWGGGQTHEPLADLSPAIGYDKFRGAWVHGRWQPTDGHTPSPGLPTWGAQQRDGMLTIEFTGGPPGMKLDVEVLWAD